MLIEITPALNDALKACSEIERNLIAIGQRADPQRKVDLVQWRRKFAEQMGHVGQLIEQDAALRQRPEMAQEMHSLLSSFRFAIGQQSGELAGRAHRRGCRSLCGLGARHLCEVGTCSGTGAAGIWPSRATERSGLNPPLKLMMSGAQRPLARDEPPRASAERRWQEQGAKPTVMRS